MRREKVNSEVAAKFKRISDMTLSRELGDKGKSRNVHIEAGQDKLPSQRWWDVRVLRALSSPTHRDLWLAIGSRMRYY